jgi:hypothetical protein
MVTVIGDAKTTLPGTETLKFMGVGVTLKLVLSKTVAATVIAEETAKHKEGRAKNRPAPRIEVIRSLFIFVIIVPPVIRN